MSNTMLDPQNRQAIAERLAQEGLALSVLRDFTMILPWIYNEQWHTSVSLRLDMSRDKSYTRKELFRLSNALSNVYRNSELLEREFKRVIYNRYWENKSNTSNWGYRLNWDYLAKIMPNPEIEEYNRQQAQINFERSLE